MKFISYAQNYEDVMLHRALKGVEHGFYVDVGANDPFGDSVTKAFYDRGWRGINVEPVEFWFRRLEEERPEDINLQLVVDAEGDREVTFYEVVETGLSTLDPSAIEEHLSSEDQEIRRHVLRSRSLSQILAEHGRAAIHFLKIDVEGAEQAVISGLDLKRFRPWIIVVEATRPNTQVECYEAWESLITSGRYHFTYFDGINRFYVADEHAGLDAAFSAPPNVFDNFVRVNEDYLEHRSEWLEREVAQRDDEIARRDDEIARLDEQIVELSEKIRQRDNEIASLLCQLGNTSAELANVYASRSWRVTAPVRWVTSLGRSLKE